MGMYDEIIVEYPLEGYEFLQDKMFQTKDFDNLMDMYKITQDGRLLIEDAEYEFVPEEERPYYGKEEWDKNPLFQLIGSLKRKTFGWKDLNYHGMFRFYTLYELGSDNRKWYEFEAKFTDGNLTELKPVEEEELK